MKGQNLKLKAENYPVKLSAKSADRHGVKPRARKATMATGLFVGGNAALRGAGSLKRKVREVNLGDN